MKTKKISKISRFHKSLYFSIIGNFSHFREEKNHLKNAFFLRTFK